MARKAPEHLLRFSPASSVSAPSEDYWELVKEGPIALPETSSMGKSHGVKGGRLHQRWMVLARLKCNCGCLTGNSKLSRGQTILLRTSKLPGGGRRKVQNYDLSCYRMITSAFSSSVGTLGPKTGGGNYHFTIHAAADYTFAAVDEPCMLSWIASLKEVLSQPPSTQPSPHSGRYFAVEYCRSSVLSSNGAAPHVSTQTTSLLELGESNVALKHPLTEEVADELPVRGITDMDVHTQRQCLEVKVCARCSLSSATVFRINTQCSVRRLAEAILLRRNLQVPGPPGQREWSCSLPHSCDAVTPQVQSRHPQPATASGHSGPAPGVPASTAVGSLPRKVTLRRRSLGVMSLEKPMTVLREGEVVNIRRSLPPDSSAATIAGSPVAMQRRSLLDATRDSSPALRDGYITLVARSDGSELSRTEAAAVAAACPSPVPRKHARLSRANNSTRDAPAQQQHNRHYRLHVDAERTESSQSNCSCQGSVESRGSRCRMNVSVSSPSTASLLSDNVDIENSDDEGYISMAAQQGRKHGCGAAAAAQSRDGSPAISGGTASRRGSLLSEDRPQPPPKPAFLRMLSGTSSADTEYDRSPGCTPGIHPGFLDYEDVETDDEDGDVEECAPELPVVVAPDYCNVGHARSTASSEHFPDRCEYETWGQDPDDTCHYVVPDNVSHAVRRSSTAPSLTSSVLQREEYAAVADSAPDGAYITFLSEGDGSQLQDVTPRHAEAAGHESHDPEAWQLHQMELQRSIKLRLAHKNCVRRFQAKPIKEGYVVESLDSCTLNDRTTPYAPRPKPRGIVRNSARTATF